MTPHVLLTKKFLEVGFLSYNYLIISTERSDKILIYDYYKHILYRGYVIKGTRVTG